MVHLRIRPLAGTTLLLLSASWLAGQATSRAEDKPETATERLVTVAKIWTTVEYFHPYRAHKHIDWDSALIRALPEIRAAKNESEWEAAVAKLLDALGDPGTFVFKQGSAPREPGEPSKQGGFTAVGERTWIHSGLPPATALASAGGFAEYYTAFVVRPLSASISPLPRNAKEHFKVTGAHYFSIPLNKEASAEIRLSEPVLKDGGLLPYDADASENTVMAAPQVFRPSTEEATDYPSLEARILAAYRVWGSFHYFFAYRDLMDEDWDKIFADFLPKFIAARDAREYHLAVAEMVSHVTDTNVSVQSRVLAEYFGVAPAPVAVRFIERRPTIFRVLSEEAKKAGAAVGDIVVKVDGEAVTERVRREAQYLSASTPQSLGDLVARRLLNGPDGSMLELDLRGTGGHDKHIRLKRSKSFEEQIASQRTGDVLQIVGANLGYADLGRLRPEEVPDVFKRFRNTKGIVFDLRGKTSGVAQVLAGRLTEAMNVAAAIATGPLSMRPDFAEPGSVTRSASNFLVQSFEPSSLPPYRGKTVALIDERTYGPAEHAALFLEAANKTAFIGTPSAGADSDVTSFVVPGGINISFSGHDIRHGNGGQLQRLGLQPSVNAVPTLGGIRAGRDEVLEKAIAYLSQEAQ